MILRTTMKWLVILCAVTVVTASSYSSSSSSSSSRRSSSSSGQQAATSASTQQATISASMQQAATSASTQQAAAVSTGQRTICSQKSDVNWVRQNAENLLYLEYLRQQAASEDVGWRSQVETDDYQTRLDELRTVNTGCTLEATVDDSFESTSSCGQTTCETVSSCGQNCEIYASRLVVFQAELKRQRLMIQRLYSQILAISQTSSTSCDCKNKFPIPLIFNNLYNLYSGIVCCTLFTRYCHAILTDSCQ